MYVVRMKNLTLGRTLFWQTDPPSWQEDATEAQKFPSQGAAVDLLMEEYGYEETLSRLHAGTLDIRRYVPDLNKVED